MQKVIIATKVSALTQVAVALAIIGAVVALAAAVVPLPSPSPAPSVTSPAADATVSGQVVVRVKTAQPADAVDVVILAVGTGDKGIRAVLAAMPPTKVKSLWTEWTATWNTASLPDAAYLIKAVSKTSGRADAASSKVPVTVRNAPGPAYEQDPTL